MWPGYESEIGHINIHLFSFLCNVVPVCFQSWNKYFLCWDYTDLSINPEELHHFLDDMLVMNSKNTQPPTNFPYSGFTLWSSSLCSIAKTKGDEHPGMAHLKIKLQKLVFRKPLINLCMMLNFTFHKHLCFPFKNLPGIWSFVCLSPWIYPAVVMAEEMVLS